MSQFQALNAALDLLNYPKEEPVKIYHSEWCATHFGYSRCNCQPGMDIFREPPKEESCTVAPTADKPATAAVMSKTTTPARNIAATVGTSPAKTATPTPTLETTNMAAALPSVDTTSIEQKHAQSLTGFAQRTKSLTDRVSKVGVTRTIAEEAQELDTEAKRWLDAFDAETKPIKDQLFKAHRLFTSFCEKMSGGAMAARATARRLIGTFQLEQARIADEKRREAERLAREEAARQRQAEADALVAQAAAEPDAEVAQHILDEAILIEAAPVIPVSVPEVVAPKVEGSSVSYKLIGTVEDPVALLMWMLERAGERYDLMGELIEFKQSGINAALKRGLSLPGVKVERQAIVRNLSGR